MKIKLIKPLLVMMLLSFAASPAAAFDIVKPAAERELVKDADLRNISKNLGIYLGLINYENFNSSYLLGFYFSYPFDEKVFVDAELGLSMISDSEYRNIGLPLLDKEKTDVSYYSVLVGYNLLAGETYWSQQKTLISRFYLLAGIGSMNFDNRDVVSLNLGLGVKLELDADKNIRIEARDRIFDTDLLGTDKLSHNSELHIGIDWNF